MVFHPEGQFRQFQHCKFRENVVGLLQIPSILFNGIKKNILEDDDYPTDHYLLVVSKYGKVGLYHPQKFSLLHTYCLDLSVPMHPHLSHRLSILTKSKSAPANNPTPKCQRTHLVTDAIYLPDVFCVVFSTTKNILQWYDIGEIQMQNIGLELFPRREFMGLNESNFAVPIPNKGHVECHRLFGLSSIPSCLEYWKCPMGKLLIGGVDGSITIIFITDPKSPLGRRKIRGKLHKVLLEEISSIGIVQYYKAHHHPVTDIYFIAERDLILSCSRDKKFSVFVKDVTDNADSIIVSISKGVNTIAHCPSLKMIATGSDDFIVRLFSQFILKMPQMELIGHRSPVLTVAFVEVHFMENAVLLSYSADSELRAWDPMTFICLQSLYPTFPVGSTIICKTPEFSRKALIIIRTECNEQQNDQEDGGDGGGEETPGEANKAKKKVRIRTGSLGCERSSGVTRNKKKQKLSSVHTEGTIILLYCNSVARIPLENNGNSSRFPFDYDDFIQEFEELSMEYDKKLKEKLNPDATDTHLVKTCKSSNLEKDEKEDTVQELDQPASGKPKKVIKVSKEEVSEIESKLDDYVREIMELKQTIKDARSSGKSFDTASADNTTGRLSTSSFGDLGTPTGNMSISVEAVDRFYEFQREKAGKVSRNLRRVISYGQAFNQYPFHELEPIEFSKKDLSIPERMKKALGIPSMSSVQQLTQPETLSYFGIQPNKYTSLSDRRRHQSKTDNKSQRSPKGRGVTAETSQSRAYTPPNSRFALFGHKMGNVYQEGDDDDEDANF